MDAALEEGVGHGVGNRAEMVAEFQSARTDLAAALAELENQP
jgi:hypothetical protein